jgi:hypothetical protein
VNEFHYPVPKFSAWMSLSIQGEEDILFTFKEEPPEEVMDRAQQLIGNGLARVSATAPMDIKDYGTGTGATVSIAVTCDQSDPVIGQAARFCWDTALAYTKQFRAEAELELRKILFQKGRLPPGEQP